jgi:DNA-binding winged helix-turn-helix (wHTH) protein
MAKDTRILYEFGPFQMDPDKQILLRGNDPVAVTPKSFETLLALVRRSREVVSKEELLKEVWPNSFVEESNLSQNIFLLRKALGDTAENRQYIVTLPGRGYKFAATVRTVTEHGEALVAQARTRTQIVIEQEQPDQAASAISSLRKAGRREFLLPAGGVVLLLALGGVFFLRHREPARLGEKDPILVADFTNTTGDPVFDGTLRQGLAIQLEQSPFLRIMDDAQVQRDLRLMHLDPGTRITPQVAHDVCVREGGAATIDGAIATLGRRYVITLQAIACHEGTTVAREQVEAEDKEHVLRAPGERCDSDAQQAWGVPQLHSEDESAPRAGDYAIAGSPPNLQRGDFHDAAGQVPGRHPAAGAGHRHRPGLHHGLLLPGRRLRTSRR